MAHNPHAPPCKHSLLVQDGVVLDLTRVRQVVHDGVQQRLDALVLQRRAHQHRGEETLHRGSTDRRLQDGETRRDRRKKNKSVLFTT